MHIYEKWEEIELKKYLNNIFLKSYLNYIWLYNVWVKFIIVYFSKIVFGIFLTFLWALIVLNKFNWSKYFDKNVYKKDEYF